MKKWTILNPLLRNNLWNNFLIFHIFHPCPPAPLIRSLHSIGFGINGKMNLNILFMQLLKKRSEKKGKMWNEWNWMKQQKAYRNPPATVILTWYLSHFMFICHWNFLYLLYPTFIHCFCPTIGHTNNIVLVDCFSFDVSLAHASVLIELIELSFALHFLR